MCVLLCCPVVQIGAERRQTCTMCGVPSDEIWAFSLCLSLGTALVCYCLQLCARACFVCARACFVCARACFVCARARVLCARAGVCVCARVFVFHPHAIGPHADERRLGLPCRS